jgi:hypothetical protein
LQIKNQVGKKLKSKMKVVQRQKLKFLKKLKISITKNSKQETKEIIEMIIEGDTMINMIIAIKMKVKIEIIKKIKENNNM